MISGQELCKLTRALKRNVEPLRRKEGYGALKRTPYGLTQLFKVLYSSSTGAIQPISALSRAHIHSYIGL